MREAKFDFQEEIRVIRNEKVKRAAAHTVTVNTKTGSIAFSMEYVRDRGLKDTYIKLDVDSKKKALGWKVLHETALGELQGYRKVSVYEYKNQKGYTTRTCSIMAKTLIHSLGLESKTFKQLPVQKYVAPTLLSSDLEYVELA